VLGVRDRRLLKPPRVGHRHIRAGQALDRRVEVVERLAVDERGEVRPDAKVAPLVADDEPVGRIGMAITSCVVLGLSFFFFKQNRKEQQVNSMQINHIHAGRFNIYYFVIVFFCLF
jgi:hypothetical protein